MYSGGKKLSDEAWRVFQKLGVLVPIILLGYNFFLQNFPEYASGLYSSSAAFVLVLLWVIVSFFMMKSDPSSRSALTVYHILYHLFSIVYILTIGGLSAPITLFWALLATVSYIIFGTVGMISSLLTLVISFSVYRTLVGASDGQLLYDLIYIAVVIVVSVSCAYLVWLQETEKKNLIKTKRGERHQRNSIETLINNLADAVVSTDPNGRISMYNASMLNLLDTNASITHETIDKVLRLEKENGEAVKLLPALQRSKALVVDDNFFMMVGEERLRLEITYSPIRSTYRNTVKTNKGDGYVIIFRDVTKIKSLEEERDEFISVVSHELRTPIAITEGSLDNARLIFNKDSSKKETIESSLNVAYEQVIFLSKMVNDLSTLSRAERGVADAAETIDITELAHSLHKEYAPEAKEKGLIFNLQASGKLGHVYASRLYLHELLQNFITNSIKYTKEGQIDLIIERNHDLVHFAVKDTGIGISKSDQAKIFQKFYRSEDYRTRETGGTGLGLYVSEKLAKKLRCKIELKSRLNHGSTFSFTLPAASSTRQAGGSQDAASAPESNAPSK